MADFHPVCPKCDKPMECGHVPDIGHGQILPSSWAPGAPAWRRFLRGIKYDADKQMPLIAYRCPTCGYVELYARPA
jgi:Domain of unknown function (DUF6487)